MKTIHVIRGERVVTPEGIKPAAVHIRNGTITAVRGYDDLPGGANVYDARGSVSKPSISMNRGAPIGKVLRRRHARPPLAASRR